VASRTVSGNGGDGSSQAERSPYDEYRDLAKRAVVRQQERVEASTAIRLKYLFDLQHIDAELQAARRRALVSLNKRLEAAHHQRFEQERTAYEEYLETLGSDGEDREERLYDASLKFQRRQLDAANQEQLAFRDAYSEYVTALREAEVSAEERAWQEAAVHLKELLEVGT
jgi:hypothetical protein